MNRANRRLSAQQALDLVFSYDSDEATNEQDEDDYYAPVPVEALVPIEDEEATTSEQHVAASGRRWIEIAVDNAGQPAERNIIRHRPGFIPGLRPGSEKESYYVFAVHIMDELVRFTNLEARRQCRLLPWLANIWYDVDLIEMEAFIGIHLLCGVYKAHYRNIKEVFGDRDGIPALCASMTLQRFECIRKTLRFDDRQRRDPDDPLSPVRHMWNLALQKFRDLYKPTATATIDEQLVEFHGRVMFRQFIPSKPGKYGIKIVWLVDNDTTYALNGLVYIGAATFPDRAGEPLAQLTTMKVVEPFFHTGINVTADNWFTSCPLLDKLVEKNITVVGTVRKHHRDLPPVAVQTANRQPKSAVHYRSGNQVLLSFVDKKKCKPVLLLSTMHTGVLAVEDNQKPAIVQFYNSSKSGVDNLDHMVRFYSCKRKTRRWPYAFFMNLVDVICVNAYVLHKTNHQVSTRYEFLKGLAHQLMEGQMRRRLQSNPSTRLRTLLLRFLDDDRAEVRPQIAGSKRGRCAFCPRSNDKKTDVKCCSCGSFICVQHRHVHCEDCKQ
jgi:hypothetical protein